MQQKFFPILLMLLVLFSCKHKANNRSAVTRVDNILPVIYIQPLGDFNDSLIALLKAELQGALPIKAILTSSIPLPTKAWYAPRHRYWADSILVILKPLHTQKNTYTLGITEEDISTKKDLQQNWGVMGLGFQPGNCCIVSTYRLYKYPQTQKQLLGKLVKVCLHELGHNAGLPHCATIHCIMTDAKGKDVLDNEHGFCQQCVKVLTKNGLKPNETSQF